MGRSLAWRERAPMGVNGPVLGHRLHALWVTDCTNAHKLSHWPKRTQSLKMETVANIGFMPKLRIGMFHAFITCANDGILREPLTGETGSQNRVLSIVKGSESIRSAKRSFDIARNPRFKLF